MRTATSVLALLLASVALAGCAQDAPHPATGTTPTTSAAQSLTGAACVQAARAAYDPAPASGTGEVTLMTHDSFTVDEPQIQAFTDRTGYTVRVVKAGDAGEALNKAILQKDAPLADAFFGVDNALIHRAKAAGLFQPYASRHLADVPDRFLEPFCQDGRILATPVDHGYVQLNHDIPWFEARGLALPKDLKDVANETYAPLTVVENPGTSSPGFAFLLATIDRFGAEGDYTYKTWWSDFVRNGGKVVSGWEQAYGDEFTQGWTEGAALDRPLVVSYSTSPAYAPMNGWAETATTGNVELAKGAWHQIEAAGVLRNAKDPVAAKALLDHLLDPAFQENASFTMVVYPVHEDARTPEAYALYATEPKAPASLPAERIDAERDAWLAGWRQATGQA